MLASKHRPNDTRPHFDNDRIEALIAEYQANRDLDSLSAIVSLTRTRAETLIRFRKTARYYSEAELLSDVDVKLLRAVEKFDPAKGTAFTFVSSVIFNVLSTSVTNARKSARRFVELDEAAANELVTNGETESRHAIDDLGHRIRVGVKTTVTDSTEQDVQRWFVVSFCEDGFSQLRHECANAAMAVYQLNHSRSRELYDLTMLEVRRVLYPELKGRRPPIAPGRLLGTRLAWMARYRPLMNAREFTKFVVLMRDLSPFCVLLIDPSNRSRRQDRCPAVTRRNVEFVLNGHPDAVPLFA
jgi:hypothetical protein